jgi:hypothetical protein
MAGGYGYVIERMGGSVTRTSPYPAEEPARAPGKGWNDVGKEDWDKAEATRGRKRTQPRPVNPLKRCVDTRLTVNPQAQEQAPIAGGTSDSDRIKLARKLVFGDDADESEKPKGFHKLDGNDQRKDLYFNGLGKKLFEE